MKKEKSYLVNKEALESFCCKGIAFQVPFYLDAIAQHSIGQSAERIPNLNPEIVKQIADKLGLRFKTEKTSLTPPKEGLSQPGYITANAKNYLLIKEMRDNLKNNPTEAEKVMWEYLRNKKTGYKIRRQHIIDDFITDFVCLSKNVVIEIDGKIHLQQKEYDELRTTRLNELGYEVIRFTNEEVFANPELVALKIKEKLDSKFDLQSDDYPDDLLDIEEPYTPPLEGQGEVFAPIDILDYIYAVLHSPSYREKYKEFLKIDFPRVPYPKDQDTFWALVKLGGEIRQIHLLESSVVENYITQYPIDGDNVVGKPRFLNSPPPEGCPTGGVVLPPPPEENPQLKPTQTRMINQTQIKFTPILELPYNPNLKQRAKELRQARNLPEVLFWMQVTKGGFHKLDFDRQRVIGNYIVDFYIKKLGLVIEIDGSSHIGKEDYDAAREEYLISLGLKVYRIQVSDIMKRMNEVLLGLENYIIENYGVVESTLVPPRPVDTPPKEGNLGKVYINETQYFDNVPQVAWDFYIGGYQPAQKWLKDRKDRKLEFEDILHYQKIIVALTETDRLIKEVDKLGVF